jgi:hypothetical protein
VPEGPDALTVEWLSAALARPVEAFDVEPLGTPGGLVGRLVRLTIRYPDARQGPARLVAKFSAENGWAHALFDKVGLYEREARFYLDIAPRGGSYAPACHYAAYDREKQRSVLLLDEASAPGWPDLGDEDIMRLASAIARYHARWWDHPLIATFEWVPGIMSGNAEANVELLADAWDVWRERLGVALPSPFRDVVEAYVASMSGIRAALEQRPRTVLHFDFHVGNVLLWPGVHDMAPTFIDSCPVYGRGIYDVAHFGLVSLSPERRRALEASMVEAYHGALREHGVTGYSRARCGDDYRLAILAVMHRVLLSTMVVLRMDDSAGEAVAMDIARQFSEAATQHDLVSLCGAYRT